MNEWIEKAVGKMHVNKITQKDVAHYLGVCNDYVSMILCGKRNPPDAERRILTAIDEIISERK